MRPNRSSVAFATALTAAASTTSASATIALPPLPSISLTTASASARFCRTLTTTAAPPAASSSAMARPMLRPAPVMTATRPFSSWSGISLSLQRGQIDPSAEYVGRKLERGLRTRRIIAAVTRVEQEFVFDVFLAERLVRAAPHVRLALLDHAAVAERHADVAGEVVGIGIVGVDAVADLLGQRDHRGLPHRFIGEIAQAHIAADEA